jgi:hypothetical protein
MKVVWIGRGAALGILVLAGMAWVTPLAAVAASLGGTTTPTATTGPLRINPTVPETIAKSPSPSLTPVPAQPVPGIVSKATAPSLTPTPITTPTVTSTVARPTLTPTPVPPSPSLGGALLTTTPSSTGVQSNGLTMPTPRPLSELGLPVAPTVTTPVGGGASGSSSSGGGYHMELEMPQNPSFGRLAMPATPGDPTVQTVSNSYAPGGAISTSATSSGSQLATSGTNAPVPNAAAHSSDPAPLQISPSPLPKQSIPMQPPSPNTMQLTTKAEQSTVPALPAYHCRCIVDVAGNGCDVVTPAAISDGIPCRCATTHGLTANY